MAACFLTTRWAAGAGSLLVLVAASVILDGCVQINQVTSQRVIYALQPQARGRINGIYMAMMFVGGACGSSARDGHRGRWRLGADRSRRRRSRAAGVCPGADGASLGSPAGRSRPTIGISILETTTMDLEHARKLIDRALEGVTRFGKRSASRSVTSAACCWLRAHGRCACPQRRDRAEQGLQRRPARRGPRPPSMSGCCARTMPASYFGDPRLTACPVEAWCCPPMAASWAASASVAWRPRRTGNCRPDGAVDFCRAGAWSE